MFISHVAGNVGVNENTKGNTDQGFSKSISKRITNYFLNNSIIHTKF